LELGLPGGLNLRRSLELRRRKLRRRAYLLLPKLRR
jgi:hypothetical protein